MNKPHPDYNSPCELKAFLDEHGMAMQKKFGQNFLVNGKTRKQLIDTLDITNDMKVWEVGPGLGAMTEEILSKGASLTAFEIDRGFSSVLSYFFSDYITEGKFSIIEGDVIKTWKRQLKETGIPSRFFGNLPYNIAATIIGDTIEHGVRFEKAVVTVQKEVAQRMMAPCGSENYSSFSVLCQWAYNIETVVDLASGNFWPRPNVESRAVFLERKQLFPECRNPDLFMKLQRALFVSRRKTVKNNLGMFLTDNEQAAKILEEAGINPQLRAEELTIRDILMLSDTAEAAIIKKGNWNGVYKS
jgi:16S rRNA (adenine1518-N6/adenine1519-N6)-dimethyltransferase